MITFHNSSNIIVTKRSSNQSQGKKSCIERNESTSNGRQRKINNKNNSLKRNTLTSFRVNKTKKISKNMINLNASIKSPSNITVKNLKSGLLTKKGNKGNHRQNNNSTKSKQNTDCNIFNDNLKLIKNRNNQNIKKRNNENGNNNCENNLIQNNGENMANISNQYKKIPSHEPISVKINKNNNYFSNRNIYNNNLFNSIDNNIKQNEYDNIQTLGNHLENNKYDEIKVHKRSSTNYINNNYYNKFVQNINNINNNEGNNSKNNKKECNECDEKVAYVLKVLELESIIDKFSSNFISFNDLFLLRRQDLLEMNVPIGKRNRLLHFLEKYKNIAINYDFNEVKNYLYKYKNLYKNNLFIDKDFIPKINIISSNITNVKNNDNINNNDLNTSKRNNIIINDNLKSILQLENKSIHINKDELNKLLNNKSELSEKNKNITIFSSISNSKRSIDDLNFKDSFQDKSTLIKGIINPKNYSTITTNNIEENETANTNENNIVSSSHFYQKCNTLLNEIDNFNTLYNQLKQKSQDRNKKLYMLLNKKNNIEYVRDKINSGKLETEIQKENIKTNELYNMSNNHFIDYNFNELFSLKEENVRNLNNELKYMN